MKEWERDLEEGLERDGEIPFELTLGCKLDGCFNSVISLCKALNITVYM